MIGAIIGDIVGSRFEWDNEHLSGKEAVELARKGDSKP